MPCRSVRRAPSWPASSGYRGTGAQETAAKGMWLFIHREIFLKDHVCQVKEAASAASLPFSEQWKPWQDCSEAVLDKEDLHFTVSLVEPPQPLCPLQQTSSKSKRLFLTCYSNLGTGASGSEPSSVLQNTHSSNGSCPEQSLTPGEASPQGPWLLKMLTMRAEGCFLGGPQAAWL